METDPYLRSDHGHGHGYGHDHLPFPSPTHDDDDACMDALLFLVDDDMFMSPEEVQPPSSCDQVVIKERNQQESLNPQELSLTDLLLMCAQVKDFLNKARKLSPKLVVVVEEELFSSRRASAMAPPPPLPSSSSFVEFFCDALHHFSSVSDSLGCSFYGGYRVGLRLVEKEMLGPRIILCRLLSVWAFDNGWVQVGSFEFLLGLFNMGFGLQSENGRLALCWKSRPLISVSSWVPI